MYTSTDKNTTRRSINMMNSESPEGAPPNGTTTTTGRLLGRRHGPHAQRTKRLTRSFARKGKVAARVRSKRGRCMVQPGKASRANSRSWGGGHKGFSLSRGRPELPPEGISPESARSRPRSSMSAAQLGEAEFQGPGPGTERIRSSCEHTPTRGRASERERCRRRELRAPATGGARVGRNARAAPGRRPNGAGASLKRRPGSSTMRLSLCACERSQREMRTLRRC